MKQNKVQDNINSIKIQNLIAKVSGIGLGVGGALAIDSIPSHPIIPVGLGGLGGFMISDALTRNRIQNYKDEILFGPYKDLVFSLEDRINSTIVLISEKHMDYSYKTKLYNNIKKFEKDIIPLKHERDILKIRRTHLTYLNNSLEIISSYIMEKRSDPAIREFYFDVLPAFKSMSDYLINTRVNANL